jgi:hypothetical protein
VRGSRGREEEHIAMHGAFSLPLGAAVSITSPERCIVAPSFPCRARGTTRRARHCCPKRKVAVSHQPLRVQNH